MSEHVGRRDGRSARRVTAVTEHLHVRHYCTNTLVCNHCTNIKVLSVVKSVNSFEILEVLKPVYFASGLWIIIITRSLTKLVLELAVRCWKGEVKQYRRGLPAIRKVRADETCTTHSLYN